MCRSIKTLFNFKPPATAEEIRAAFNLAVEQVAAAAHRMLDSLQTSAERRERFGTP